MKTVALLAVALALLAQARNPSPRELLNVPRPLTIAEIAVVLNASRAALTGKTFRLSSAPGRQELEVLMGPAGQPKIVRYIVAIRGGIVGPLVPGSSTPPTETLWREDVITLVDHTGRPARHCDGSGGQGEMVIEYVRRSSTPTWTATARSRGPGDDGRTGIAPVFEMLRGDGPLTSHERRQLGGRWARALVSPWTPPPDRSSTPPLRRGDPLPNVIGDPAPNDAIQSLWIDTESLLLLRWEVSRRGVPTHGFDFTDETIDLRRPDGIEAPECIR